MAWQPPEDELDTNVLQQSKPPEDELVKNIPDQWSPPKAELVKNIPDQWSPPEDELDNSPTKIKDAGTLQQMKQSGQELTREQERILFDAEDKKDFTQKASEAITTFVPTGIEIAKQLGTGAGEFLYKGVLKPIDSMSQSPEEVEKTWKEAKNTWRSGVSGVAGDIQETSDALVRFSMFGSSITDKLLGKSNDERFEKYMLREGMRQFAQKVYADDPDNAARLLAENPLLQKLASAAALAQGATPEEAELAKKAYEELVKEQGLTKDEINENVSMLGEILSPISLPGTNRITNTFAKATGKVTRKAGELALKGVVAPLAKGVAKTAGGLESGIEKIQGASRKIGEYAVGDPDTFVKTATNTIVGPAKLPAKMTRGIATTIGDVAGQAGQGRRGMFELAGRAPTSGELTKKLFGPQAMGGKGRARVADWAVRQSNAIIQPAVNGAVLNVALGLPDIETARDLGYSAGVGAGIGAYGGARLAERGGALIDPTTGLAEKIDAIVTPDPSQLRKDEDADIKRFIKTADPTLMSSIDELSNVNNIKSSLDLKIKNLEAKKVAQINKDDERRIQDQIDNFTEQRKALDKSTPQTEAEIKRQVQLSFTDAMDLAKTTGAAAGLNNIQVKVLRPDQMEDFYRNLYGKTLTDAESVVQQLVGNPRLSPSEKEMLGLADQTIKQYLQDVAGSSTARGFAISEQTGKPNHLKMQNQTGATVVINGDLVTQMGRDGLNLGRVINHEMQHALSNFQEVRDMIAPIRKELFDQKVINADGTFEVVKKGVIPDSELDKFALQYSAAMDASGGASFLSNFANQDQLRNYMKEEYLSELAGLSGGIQGNLRGNLDSVGRSVVDWIESRTKNGALKRVKEALRNYGVIVDDQGQFSSVIGGELNPEALAMMRQYQRGLRDLNESLVYNSDPVKDEAEIPLTVFSTNRALQQRYKDSEFFEQQQVVKMTTPDGQTQEIVIPPNVKVDSFISDYRFSNGELVDDLGNVISLGPDIPLQAMPDGTSLSVDTRIARNADGSPRIISPRESKRRAKKRGEAIRKAIDEAPEDASGARLEDTGNGNYRGTLSPTQVAAINALPNDLVAPSLKRKIAFFNEILGRKDGSIVEIEYQAAIRDKKYRALQPQMRTEIPFGFQFDKQGNFLMTTMSMSRMHDKANAWAAKRPRNLRLWGGDMTKFWDSVRQYLYNHKQGLQGHIGLNPDPEIAMEMKNRINDLFNVYRKETRDANPDRTTLPKRKGQDSRDVVIRSRRMDRINSYDETALAKMPFSYESAVKNYLPVENPLAELQSPEQFAQAMEIDTEIARLAAQGNVEPLELQLHQQDLLHPAEYIDVENEKLRVRSMFDPTQAILEPMESEPEVSASSTQFMPEAPIEATENDKRTNVGISFMPASKEDYAYRGQHKAPDQESGSPLNKVTQSIYPDDFYDLPFEKTLQYYGSGEPRSDSESLSAILSAKDKPNTKVKVYRAVPKYAVQIDPVKAKEIEDRISKFEKLARLNPWSEDFKKQLDDALAERPQVISDINAGDWVTPSRSYAADHGESALNGQYRILSKSVPASHLFTEGNSLSEFGYNPPSAKGIQFMPAETERYPTSERGMYSGLQKTIDEKVQGKFASPEQLKAIVTNPQNAKAEELKWSGVLGEIDRLAAENNGKVPKDKVMDYLRNEGAVKFEEVTLGQNNSIQKIANEYRIKIEDEYGEKAFYDEFDEPLEFDELPIRLQDAIEQGKNVLEPKHSTYQLPGGTNYREVVMTMPDPKLVRYNELNKIGATYMTDEQFAEYKQLEKSGLYKNQYTSSHFPDTPNYVAHMRLNERTDAQGNEGLFIEELQSDRHQAGRDVGYIDEKLDIPEGYRIEKSQIRGFIVFDPEGISLGGKNTEIEAIQAARMNAGLSGAKMQVPDAPFRKDWSIQLFKRALRDAVDADKKWIGWTTGIEQVKRYEQAMRQAVDEITWNTPKGYQKSFAAIKNGNTVLAGKINDDGSVYDSDTDDANGKQLSEVVGKEVASKILAENSGTATGDDLTVGGEGMKGFYDQILPKEIGKYVAKMGGKVEKSEIDTEKSRLGAGNTPTLGEMAESVGMPVEDFANYFINLPREQQQQIIDKTKVVKTEQTPIWRVDITPEMAGKVRGGQLQFMPAEKPTEYEPISARIRPLEGISAPTKVVGAKALSLGEIEPPVRGKAMLPDMELGTTESDDKLTKLKEFAPKTEDKEGYIGVKSIGNKEGQLKFADLLDSNVEQTKNNLIFLKKRLEQEKNSREKELYRDKIRFNNDLIQQFGDASKTIRYLDSNNIPFQIDNSLRTGSVYIKTGTKDFRFSSHSQTPYGFKTLNGFDDVLSHFEPILTPDMSEKGIQSSDIITSAKPAPDAVIKPFSNALVSSAGLINFLPAWHGTPHEVDKFKLEKIGTGEGAQAYGWGLYFGQARSVGEKYKENLSEYKATLDGRKVAPETLYVTFGPKYPGYLDGVINSQGLIERWLRQPNAQNPYPDGSQRSNLWNEVSSRAKSEGKGGNLYKVDLDVKDEDLLDWDKPLSEQSDKIRENVLNESKLLGDLNREWNGQDLYKNLVDEYGGEKQASEYLNSIGIPGIRYLDGMSRTSASDINRRDELLKEGAQLRKTLENNPKDWEMRKQFKDWLTASEQELAALEKQIKSAETSPTHNYVIFDENLITILDKNDKPVQGELPTATGLQFMPASPVTKTQTGYDYTYLDEALKNGKNGKVALTRPVRADEALPLLSQRIPITNQVDRNSFDYLSPAEVEFYQYENNPVSFKFDPALLKKPVFKDAAVEHAGKNVQLAMADRQTASGGDMGGIMFTWLKSNIDSTVIGDDGIEYRAVWGNQEWKPVLSMKNKNKNFNAYNLLTYLMGPDAHASNTREVRTISNEIENAPITREQKDLFLILSNIGVKKQKTAYQQKNIKSANKVIEKTKTLLSKTKDQAKINKLNKIIQTKERNINIAKSKLDKFVETINEELLKKVITKYKTAYTRFKNKTGNEVNLTKNLKELNDFKKTKQFKDLIKLIGNKQLISLDNTFKGRKAAIAEILGLTIDAFNVDNILDQTMDFKNGRINQIVGSIELSRNPELMAVYLGNDPKQAKRMTPQEAKAAAQLKANPNFVPHEAYAWAMLGPVKGNHFLNSNPKTHLEYFADFKEAYANIQATADKKKKILEGNETTLMGAMRDNTQMPLAMPKISSKK